jgi:non-specific serine/threonine protein kinase
MARSAIFVGRGEFAQAVSELRAAIEGLEPDQPRNLAERDALRVDLIRTLTFADQDAQALHEGRTLIDEARARGPGGDLVVALAQMAMVRAHGEDLAAAETLLLAAQPVIVARLGENHSRHISLMGELLRVAFNRADWPRAIDYARQVHERARAKFGPDHVTTYTTLGNVGRTLSEAGRPAQAVVEAQVAYEHLRRLAGTGSPLTQDVAFVLALSELELGRVARAEALIEQLDAAVLESWRTTGHWAPGIEALRGIALQRRGDHAAAQPLLDSFVGRMKGEEELAQPARLYLAAKEARGRIR